jgi:hypothetical protein
MNSQRRAFTLVELLVALAVTFFLFLLIPWTFQGFACQLFLTALFLVSAVYVAFKRRWKAFVAFLAPVVACVVGIGVMLPTVFPTRFAGLHGGTYENTPLVSVLSDVAAQGNAHPFWRFLVSDRTLAQQPVTVHIPDGCSLGRSLDIIKTEAGCEYTWYWNKGCGNAPSPGYAAFCFFPPQRIQEHPWNSEVIIDPDGLRYRPGQ